MKLDENTLTEQPLIEWFKELGYEYAFGPEISPGGLRNERGSFKEVVLRKRLFSSLQRLNPEIPSSKIEDAIYKLTHIEHPNLEIANKEVFRMLSEGIVVEVKDRDGNIRGKYVKVFDFENPLNNEFRVVNQFTVQEKDIIRRFDVVVFINGIPVAIFELKNPATESATLYSAYLQLQRYKKEVPEIFKYNQILVISDLLEARCGTISSSWEWFLEWKRIEDEEEKHSSISKLEILAKGIFHKIRLLDIIENFIIFEADAERDVSKYTKKICLYHQYYGVNRAVAKTLKALRPKGDGRIGVFWHTQGSGKTLSMVFYVNKVRKIEDLKSPTFVFLTDRNDLDDQFYKTFLRTGFARISSQAESIDNLKEKLRTASGELIFTTIQKFQGEDFEVLSEKENIIVITDEAHRSQYAKLAGNARKALPNASFMGITGTPISLHNRDTRLVFGEYISIYSIDRAVEDKATVRIYYEPRLVPLHLSNYFIDEEFEELLEEVDLEEKEKVKRKLAKLEEVVSVEDRLEKIARDIVEHFNKRGLEGKAMVVVISRKTAVKMYKLISKIADAPPVAIVISKPEEFKGEIQQEINNKEIEKRFKNPNDPLKIVIVCDMWLTGFDVPHLHTMYFDKPLKNHTLIQAVARVNRIYKDKEGGLIVDYIGILDDLRKSLNLYSSDVQKQVMLPLEEITSKMLEKYDIVKSFFVGIEYSNWKKMDDTQKANLFQEAINCVITDPKSGNIDEERKKKFIKEAEILFRLHSFVMPHYEALKIKDDIEFFRAIKKAMIKIVRTPAGIHIDRIDSTMKELISKSISAEGVIDIFSLKGKEKPEVSIFDEKFLEELRKMKFKNIAIEVLRKLLNDELKVRIRKNKYRYKSLYELLEKIIEDYENRILNSEKIIEELIKLAKEIKKAEKEGQNLGLSEEELAFYDAISKGKSALKSDEELKRFVKELVKRIKRDLTIDWTNNEIIKARIRANVRIALLQFRFMPKEVDKIIEDIFSQAVSLYEEYVPAGV